MVAIDFPAAPTINQTVTLAGTTYVWNGQGWTVQDIISGGVTVGDAAPAGAQGDLWWESDTGVLWLWYADVDGGQWVQVNGTPPPPATGGGTPVDAYTKTESDARFVNIPGDTMTSHLTISADSAALILNNINPLSPTQIMGQKNGLHRWIIKVGDETADVAPWTGSDFVINAYDATGVTFTECMRIQRASGSVTFPYAAFVGTTLNVTGDAYFSANAVMSGALSVTGIITTTATLDTTNGVNSNGPINGTTGVFSSTFNIGGLLTGNGSATINGVLLSASTFQQTNSSNYWSGGSLVITGYGYQPGGGTWYDSSDSRIKTVLGPYLHGLAEIKQINPVRYQFKGNVALLDPARSGEPAEPLHQNVLDKEYVGIVAQDVEAVFPETVTQIAGFVDGQPVSDLRIYNSSALTYALINAVKQLSAEVERLKAHTGLPELSPTAGR